jgi:hypothetical protein
MAVGKIASSTGNYTTNGGALTKDSTNGFNAFNFPVTMGRTLPQLFAPSLNLGVSVINTVAPAIAGYTQYTNGPGLGSGNVGIGYCFTENNITIVTPDSLPTNPNNAISGLSFQRYEVSLTDWARGLGSSVVIGSDMFTPNNYVNGGFNTPNGSYTSFGPYQTFIGKNNGRGIGANEVFNGYNISILGNTIVGGNNVSTPVNDQGNFACTYTADGANGYAPVKRFRGNSILGNMNMTSSISKSNTGYGRRFDNNTVLGTQNLTTIREYEPSGRQVNALTSYLAKAGESRIDVPKYSSLGSQTVIGQRNLCFTGNGRNSFDGTYEQWPLQSMGYNIVMGGNNLSNSINNWYPAGAGDQSNDKSFIGYNIVIGNNITFNKKVKSLLETQVGGYGYTTKNTVIAHGYGGSTNFTGGFNNVIVGNAARNNFSSDESLENGASGFQQNVIIGDLALDTHGASGVTTITKNCVVIGYQAHPNASNGQENIVVIGAQAEASSPTVNNEITLGNSSIATLRCNVTSITSLSDARDKANIEPISNASAFIKDLKPVKFDWNRRDGVKAKEHDIGFLAQDLDEAQSKHGIQEHLDIVYKSNPEALEASYGKLLPILVQALKEQQEEIEKLKSTN